MRKIITFLFILSIFSIGVYSQTPIDIVLETKNKIYKYYDRENFDEPEWIRVKNFLNWLNENETSLNEYFSQTYLTDSNTTNADIEKFIFAFLGANYVSQQIINKKFNLPIRISREGCFAYPAPVHICVEPLEYMEILNLAMHEAAHLLLAIENANIVDNNHNMQHSDILSEEITIFTQLKYALPLKSGKILHGTKAFFIYSNEETENLKLKNIKGEYADIVYPVVNYSTYDKNKILNSKTRKSRSVYQILQLIFNGINSNYLGKDFTLNEDEIYYLQSPVFQDTKKYMENDLFTNLSDYDNYSKGYLQKILSDNEEELLLYFIKNLRKYADKDIPLVPNGYI